MLESWISVKEINKLQSDWRINGFGGDSDDTNDNRVGDGVSCETVGVFGE